MIRIENLHKSYPIGKDSLHVLKGLNLHIKEGEFVSFDVIGTDQINDMQVNVIKVLVMQ